MCVFCGSIVTSLALCSKPGDKCEVQQHAPWKSDEGYRQEIEPKDCL